MKKHYFLTLGCRLTLVLALLMGLSGVAHAQLGTYSFLNSSGDEPTFPVDAQPINAQLSPMSRGAGVTPSTGAGTFAAVDWTTGATPDAADYFSFTAQPAPGFRLRLDSLKLDERRSGTGIRDWVVRSSADNFTANLVSVNVPDDTNTRTNTKVTLPLASFGALTGPVEFRIYGYNAEAAAGSWRIDNVRVYGLVTTAGGTTTPELSFGTPSATVNENAGTIQIPVRLSAPSAQAISVQVALATPAGTATSPADYTFTTQTVVFPANSTTTQNVNLTIVDDAIAESSETIILSLQNASPVGAATIAAGNYTITITDNDTPTGPVVSAISALTVNDAAGVPTQNGQVVSARGTVYGVNQRTAGYQLTLIDNTGGIGIFASANLGTPAITLTEGDSITVVGTLGQFNGLTQITMTSITSAGRARRTYLPRAVTGPLTENEESELISIATPVTLVTPSQWTGAATAYNVDVRTAAGVTYQMRIQANSDFAGRPAPTGPFLLTGIGGQFDNATPFTEGYQIAPRRYADLAFVQATREPGFAKNLSVFPNPAAQQLTLRVGSVARGAKVEVLNALGQAVRQTVVTGEDTTVDIAALRSGIYQVRVTTAEGSATRRFVKL